MTKGKPELFSHATPPTPASFLFPGPPSPCSWTLTVIKNRMREDRCQAEGPARWVPHCHLEAEAHCIQVIVPTLLLYGNCQKNKESGWAGSSEGRGDT